MVTGNREITVIQGDTYKKTISIQNVDHVNIQSIYISCNDLGINKVLNYDAETNKYIFNLSAEETAELKPCVTNYDTTIYFIDDVVKTVQYKAKISVLPKINKVNR